MGWPVLVATVASTLVLSGCFFAAKTDNRIESMAQGSYVFKTFLSGDNITIQVKDGVTTLTGTVFDESHKLLAGDIVASLPGVTEVENKLTERGKAPALNTDAWLVGKVKTLLLFHKGVDAAGTEVIARDGAITLRGKAASMAQKDLTIEYVKDVEGVNNVKSEMTVASIVLKPGEKTPAQKMAIMDEAIDDPSITVLVEMTLLSHRSTSALTPMVQTRNGVVRLRGNARNAATKDLISRFAGDVHGVKKVINTMSFE